MADDRELLEPAFLQLLEIIGQDQGGDRDKLARLLRDSNYNVNVAVGKFFDPPAPEETAATSSSSSLSSTYNLNLNPPAAVKTSPSKSDVKMEEIVTISSSSSDDEFYELPFSLSTSSSSYYPAKPIPVPAAVKKDPGVVVIDDSVSMVHCYAPSCQAKHGFHVTLGHRCTKCGSVGHDASECGKHVFSSKDHRELVPRSERCSIANCIGPYLHTINGHMCDFCHDYGHQCASKTDSMKKFETEGKICKIVECLMRVNNVTPYPRAHIDVGDPVFLTKESVLYTRAVSHISVVSNTGLRVGDLHPSDTANISPVFDSYQFTPALKLSATVLSIKEAEPPSEHRTIDLNVVVYGLEAQLFTASTFFMERFPTLSADDGPAVYEAPIAHVTISSQDTQRELDALFDKIAEEEKAELADTSNFVPGPALKTKLLPHQTQGVAWMLRQETKKDTDLPVFWRKRGHSYYCRAAKVTRPEAPKPVLGGLCADDMGLGKTIQIISLILHNRGIDPNPFVGQEAEMKDGGDDDDDEFVVVVSKSKRRRPAVIISDDEEEPKESTQVTRSKSVESTMTDSSETFSRAQSLEPISRIQSSEYSQEMADLVESQTQTQTQAPTQTQAATRTPSKSGDSSKEVDTEPRRPTLVVCPSSVIQNWQLQIETHTKPGALKVYIYQGSRNYNPKFLSDHDVVITSYGTLRTDFSTWPKAKLEEKKKEKKPRKVDTTKKGLFEVKWHRVVLDEAHEIRNRKTNGFRACDQLDTRYRWALTGTPLQNSAEDVFSILSFLRVEPFNEWSCYQSSISAPTKQGRPEGLAALRVALKPVTLRRLKNILSDLLPNKTVETHALEMGPGTSPFAMCYNDLFNASRMLFSLLMRGDENGNNIMSNYSTILEVILRLRQASCHHKMISNERLEASRSLLVDIKAKIAERERTGEAIKIDAEEAKKLLARLKSILDEEKNEEMDKECAVCMEDLDETSTRMLRTCGHYFCATCIATVLANTERSKTCPLCRKDFREGDVISQDQLSKVISSVETEEMAVVPVKRTRSKRGGDADDDDDGGDEEAPPVPSDVFDAANEPPKIKALMSALQATESGVKSVVFSYFTGFLNLIEQNLIHSKIKYTQLRGAMTAKRRATEIDRFANDPEVKVFLISLKAGGVGLNLTAGSQVFMMDVWWNSAVEEQAYDRVHRIGQKREVKVVRFIMKDSIEEKIVAIQEKKKTLAAGSMRKLTPDELRKTRLETLRQLFDVGTNTAPTQASASDNSVVAFVESSRSASGAGAATSSSSS